MSKTQEPILTDKEKIELLQARCAAFEAKAAITEVEKRADLLAEKFNLLVLKHEKKNPYYKLAPDLTFVAKEEDNETTTKELSD